MNTKINFNFFKLRKEKNYQPSAPPEDSDF